MTSQTQDIEARLKELGLVLPAPLQFPAGATQCFAWVQVSGRRVLISGHGPLNADGSIAQPLGKLGADLTVPQGIQAARLTCLAMLSTLKQELGDLNRISRWMRIFGMVNSAPDFNQQTPVINGFSELLLDIFGEERGLSTRCAVGMASLPYDIPVEVEAEIEID
jgi:enamine deaminase RidA (YjgF/YER057c/UK114 family)